MPPFVFINRCNRQTDARMATTGAVVALFMNSARRREKIDSEMNNFEKIEYFSKKRCGKIWWIQKKVVPLHSLIINGNRKLYKVS